MKEKISKYIRYTFGGLLNLSLKIITVAILDVFAIPAFLNYFIVQIFVLFFSYTYHSGVTFNEKMNFQSFIQFTKCIIGLKIVDYLLFNVNVYLFHTENVFAVIISTLAVFVLRFVLMDKYIFNQRCDDEKSVHDRCDDIR